MRSGRRGTYIWLILLGIVVVAALVASIGEAAVLSPAVAALLMVSYMAVAFLSLSNFKIGQLGQMLPPLVASARMSAAARKASQRARNRTDFAIDGVLSDVGLVVNEKRRDGRWDRRLAESVTMDDGAIQPYIILQIPPESADRLAKVEFELYDQAGRLQFSHTFEHFLRDGRNLILCERHLPLRGSEALGRAGTWDLRVNVDGGLVGIHGFSMGRGTGEPREAPGEESASAADSRTLHADDEPMSLEDLLLEQERAASRRSGSR